jgi:hypothetical protein
MRLRSPIITIIMCLILGVVLNSCVMAIGAVFERPARFKPCDDIERHWGDRKPRIADAALSGCWRANGFARARLQVIVAHSIEDHSETHYCIPTTSFRDSEFLGWPLRCTEHRLEWTRDRDWLMRRGRGPGYMPEPRGGAFGGLYRPTARQDPIDSRILWGPMVINCLLYAAVVFIWDARRH